MPTGFVNVNERLWALANASPLAIVALDTNGRVRSAANVAFLQKSVAPERLAQKVRDVLAERP